MRYWAINKKTKVPYGPYTEAEKNAFESRPETNVFEFQPVQESIPAPKPAIVKPAQPVEIATEPKPKAQRKRKKSE